MRHDDDWGQSGRLIPKVEPEDLDNLPTIAKIIETLFYAGLVIWLLLNLGQAIDTLGRP